MSVKQIFGLLVATLVAAALPAQVRTRTQGDANRNQRPLVGVAYVSVADGELLKTDEHGDTFALRAGDEVVAGDVIATTAASRAEVQLNPGNFIRLSANSQLRVVQLGNRRFQFELESGHVGLSQWKHSTADVEIQAGTLTMVPLKHGTYRVEREGDRATAIVRKGEADIGSPSGFRTIDKGQRLVVCQDRSKERTRAATAPNKDEFDDWSERRDKVLDRDKGSRYAWLPSHIYGGYGYGGYGRHGYGLGVGYGYPRYYGPRYSVGVRYVGHGRRGGHRGGRGRRF
jgi:ferric-dicitrate binding protein FerR (iron transport regulator)